MNHEVRTNQGMPWVLFIPTESGEMSLRPIGDPRRPNEYEAVLSDLGMSRARDIMGLVKSKHFSLGFPGVAGPTEGSLYRLKFEQGCDLLGIYK